MNRLQMTLGNFLQKTIDKAPFFLFAFFVILGCSQSKKVYRINAFSNEGGWGYSIIEDDKELIYQPHIPVIQGYIVFCCEEQAEKIAQLVVYKLENGTNPPTISIKELDSLNIKYD